MSLRLLGDQMKRWRPCSCKTHRPSAAHSPETDPQPATKEQNPLQILSPHFTPLFLCPPQVIHFFWMSLSFQGRFPHKPAVGLQLTGGQVQGEGFVTARTPPRWFPSKQQAVELLEVDVPPPQGRLISGSHGGVPRGKKE